MPNRILINPQLLIPVMTMLMFAGSNTAIASVPMDSSLSAYSYDKMKNCTTDLSKHPNSIEYLTYFNCGHVSTSLSNGQTIRDFTLIIQENQKIPVSNEGHIFNGWTFNGTIPGPTMRVTQGDHVRIKVINSPGNQHAHSLHLHSIHAAVMDGVSMGGYEGGAIPPGGSFVYEFIAQPYGVFPYHCHVNPIADHINRGLYGMLIIDPKTPRPQMTEFAMLMNGYDLNFDQEGPVTIPTAQESNSDQKVTKEPVLKVSHDPLQSKANSDKDNQLLQTVQSKSDSQDNSANIEVAASGTNKVDQNPGHSQGKSSSAKDKEVNSKDETNKKIGDNQAPSAAEADAADAERDNEVYTVNGKAFDYMTHPIEVQAGKP